MEPLSRSNPEAPTNVTDMQAFRERAATEGLAQHAEIVRQRRDAVIAKNYLLLVGPLFASSTDLTTRLLNDLNRPLPAYGNLTQKQERERKIIKQAAELLNRVGYPDYDAKDDPYDAQFDEAFAVLDERAKTMEYAGIKRTSQQQQALMLLRQLHRATMMHPDSNPEPYTGIPTGIAAIVHPGMVTESPEDIS